MSKATHIDFKTLKKRISITDVLKHYDLLDTLEERGKSLRGPCPFCGAGNRQFSVSPEKNAFHCFACEESGNILAFVVYMESDLQKMEGDQAVVRKAAQRLNEWFPEKETEKKAMLPRPSRDQPRAERIEKEWQRLRANDKEKTESKISTEQDETPEPPPERQRNLSPELPENHSTELTENKPLTFELKTFDDAFPVAETLGVSEETVSRFGIRYFSGNGFLKHHIVFGVHNHKGERVAYIGLNPKTGEYKYPDAKHFNPKLELYNLTAGVESAKTWDTTDGLILVATPLEALILCDAGHHNTVAFLGEDLSERQVELITTHYGLKETITLLFPTDRSPVESLDRLIGKCFVRLVRYPKRETLLATFRPEDVPSFFD